MALPPMPVPMVTYNWGDDLNDYLVALSTSAEPAGVIKAYGGSVAPVGWVFCDGAVVSRGGIYSALFNAVGTMYGVGDNVSTFQLPNLKGRLLVGIDYTQNEFSPNVQVYGGSKSHSLSSTEIPYHVHNMSHDHGWSGSFTYYYSAYGGPQLAVDYPTPDLNEVCGDPLNISFAPPGVSGSVHTMWGSTGGAGGSLAHTNLMPYALVNYIISLGN